MEGFNVTASSVPHATFDYLASLEWITATENLCLVGPAGTGKSHLLIALGHAAIRDGKRVRYFAAADLVEHLYRGLADNSVAKIIENLLRADLVIVDELGFAPLDLAGSQLLFRRRRRIRTPLARHRQPPAVRRWGRFLPEHTTAASMLDRLLHHAVVVVTEGRATGCAKRKPEEVVGPAKLHE